MGNVYLGGFPAATHDDDERTEGRGIGPPRRPSPSISADQKGMIRLSQVAGADWGGPDWLSE